MREAGREIPKVAFLHVGDIGAALVVENRDAARAIGHMGPFGREVPVQLPDPTGGQPHIDAGNGFGDGEVRLRHLSRPAAVLDALRRIVE